MSHGRTAAIPIFFCALLVLVGCAYRPHVVPRPTDIALAIENARQRLQQTQEALQADLRQLDAASCPDTCRLAQRICEAAGKICEIAKAYPGEPDFVERCRRAQGDCDAARQRCRRCAGG